VNPRIAVTLQTFWLLTVLPAAGLAILLLISTVTLSGALVGAGVLIFWLAFPWIGSERAGVRWFNRIGSGLGLSLLIAAWLFVPPGKSPQQAKFASIYEGPAKFRSWVPSQLVPEIDQHLMGSRVFTGVDPFIDGKQAKRLRRSLKKIYLPMRDDPEFAATGNAMGVCYHSLAFGQRKSGQRYEYIPESDSREPMPAILFLHGSLGNFKGYLWVWKQFADENGVAIVAPSFGRGEWREDGGIRVITDAFGKCRKDSRIFLAGLSNGGAGVTIAIPEVGDQVAGLIYLSPVLEPAALNQPHVLKSLESIPVLLISGVDDRRIPVSNLRQNVRALKANGTEIQSQYIENEDHFLFFSQPEIVIENITTWYRGRQPASESGSVTPAASADPAR